ncbi:NADH-ubiquinone oxidoreductase chain 5-like 1, partial [Homarus americanus]
MGSVPIGALIVRPNIIRIVLGWDCLGLVSFALVISYQNEKSANAVVTATPTPVSALVHSSTLVTAGVYLLIRFSPALIGSEAQSTIFITGLGANFEYDLTKIIALSTLRQLGVILSCMRCTIFGWVLF